MAQHRIHVCSLYRQSLRVSLSWSMKREIWYPLAYSIRDRFRGNMNETDPATISSLVQETEYLLKKYRHPDPYYFPHSPGGSCYQRNTPPPLAIVNHGWSEPDTVDPEVEKPPVAAGDKL